jgi:hypothetical protein
MFRAFDIPLPPEVLARLDQLALERGLTREELAESLALVGLDAVESVGAMLPPLDPPANDAAPESRARAR